MKRRMEVTGLCARYATQKYPHRVRDVQRLLRKLGGLVLMGRDATRHHKALNNNTVLAADQLDGGLQEVRVLCKREPTQRELRMLQQPLEALAMLAAARGLHQYYGMLEGLQDENPPQLDEPDVLVRLTYQHRKQTHHWHTVRVERMDPKLREEMCDAVNSISVERILTNHQQMVDSGLMREMLGGGFKLPDAKTGEQAPEDDGAFAEIRAGAAERSAELLAAHVERANDEYRRTRAD